MSTRLVPFGQSVDLDPLQRITAGFEQVLGGFLEQVPQIVLALVLLLVGILLARPVRWATRRSLSAATDRSESFLRVMSRIAGALTITLFAIVGLVIAVPGIDLGAVVGALGISSIAIGFAFSDILQNTLAGLLILFRQPFRVGDQIIVGDHAGTVVDVSIRETSLKTFDGRIVLIPNADVYAARITVQTARDTVRTSVKVGVDYDANLDLARSVALQALASVPAVVPEPAAQAYYEEFGSSSINLDLRFWTDSRQADVRAAQDQVVEAVTNAFREHDIEIPYDILDLKGGGRLADALVSRSG